MNEKFKKKSKIEGLTELRNSELNKINGGRSVVGTIVWAIGRALDAAPDIENSNDANQAHVGRGM